MSELTYSAEKLRALANMACNGELTERTIAQLEQLLYDNAPAQQFYLAHVCLDRRLRWELARQVREPRPRPSTHTFGFLSSTLHGTIGYSSGWPVAYLTATVITGLGILGFWLMPVSRPEQLAQQSDSLPSPSGRGAGGEGSGPRPPVATLVGRITGLVDCKWAEKVAGDVNQKLEIINHKSLVSLGDKVALASGLMEITYDTGAKVILQGPVTYEVETNGGYLAVGKLTGKLGERGEGREERGESDIHHSSFIIHPFSIHTPTATVTDLGTEFGVEVDRSGLTISHVFRGSVRVQGVDTNGTTIGREITLGENESARLERSGVQGDVPRLVIFHSAGEADRFVRSFPRRSARYRSGLITYDGFPTSGSLYHSSPSFGSRFWWNSSDQFACAAGSLPLPIGHLPASGGHVRVTCTKEVYPMAKRYMLHLMSSDIAETYYLSFAYARPSAASGGNFFFAGFVGDHGAIFAGTICNGQRGIDLCRGDWESNSPFGSAIDSTAYFYVLKIVMRADDTPHKINTYLKVYSPTDTLPSGEPSTWDATMSKTFSEETTYSSLCLTGNSPPGTVAQFDEVRVGTTWESVAGLGPARQEGGEKAATQQKGKAR